MNWRPSTIHLKIFNIILISEKYMKCKYIRYLLNDLWLGHNKSPKCLRIFPFSRLRQKAHGAFDRSAEDVHSSMTPDHTSNFYRGPCSLCSCFAILLWTFDFEHCLFSPHAISIYIKMCFLKLRTKNHIHILILIWEKFKMIRKNGETVVLAL